MKVNCIFTEIYEKGPLVNVLHATPRIALTLNGPTLFRHFSNIIQYILSTRGKSNLTLMQLNNGTDFSPNS